MDDMNPNEAGMVMDLEGLAKFLIDGLRVINELESEERDVILTVTDGVEYKGTEVTLADYARKYEELFGRKPYDSRMISMLKQIYHPKWKQPELFNYAEFDEPIGDIKIPANMYRGEYGLFDPEPE
jgi:hypothetical protein